MIAPSLAGILAGIALFGLAGAYFVSTAIATLSFVLLFQLPETHRSRAAEGDESQIARYFRAKTLAEIGEGVRYAMSRRELRRPILTSIIVVMFGFKLRRIHASACGRRLRLRRCVRRVHVRGCVGPVPLSLRYCWRPRADSSSVGTILIGLGFGFGASVIALSWAPNYAVAMLIAVAVGAASTGFISLIQTIVMRSTDEAYQGRVQSLVQLPFAAFAIAAAPLGVLAEWVGVQRMFLTMGIAVTLAMAVYAMTHVGKSQRSQSVDVA